MALMKFRRFEPLIRTIDVFSRCCAGSLEFYDHSELGESQLQRRNFGHARCAGVVLGKVKWDIVRPELLYRFQALL